MSEQIRIGSALFNADHSRLGEELKRIEAAGADFFHLDVFDGYFVPDQAFPARTIKTLRPLTKLPFEVHLAVQDPVPFLPALADAGTDLVYLPAESTALLYETIYATRERGMKAGLVLALGTPLAILSSTLPMLDSVLLLGRVTGEGKRGRDFNDLVVNRVREVRSMIDAAGLKIDLQAAGGLERANCIEVCRAGARSLPLGQALHRESDAAAYLAELKEELGRALPLPTRVAASAPRLRQASAGPFNVLVASRSFGKNCPHVLEEMKQAGCRFMPNELDRAPTEDELLAKIEDADALISGVEPVTRRVLDGAKKLKVIAKHGVGLDNIDLAAARERGIPVAVVGSAIVDSVADLTLALLLALARQVPQANASARKGEWKRFVGVELRGRTLGIAGLGQIGKAVARRSKGFGLKLAAFDAKPDQEFARNWGIELVDWEELLGRADFLTLHAPLLPATRGMLNAEAFEKMKKGAFLINTARGELVDETALADYLKNGHLGGAASDVFCAEPPGNHPLFALDNFIAIPHCGAQTHQALRQMGEVTAENALRALRGEPPLYQA